ncbi:uncharacterized protein LOC124651573 [Lolium rigidum]|uniref:uncharacterized protein LOC124651573 n=1 Tax=Lolium rigidum TaxID=89674 RepID=UPI001F5DB1BD|nr:uncharacterized protein LOC124651573 [Lolium rigidum]
MAAVKPVWNYELARRLTVTAAGDRPVLQQQQLPSPCRLPRFLFDPPLRGLVASSPQSPSRTYTSAHAGAAHCSLRQRQARFELFSYISSHLLVVFLTSLASAHANDSTTRSAGLSEQEPVNCSKIEAMRLAAALLVILAAAASMSFFLLLVPAAASRPSPLFSSSTGGMAAGKEEEEKVRLGSSPPNCRNKCYECSPCVAVQVPSLSAPSRPAATTARAGAGDVVAARGGVPLPPPLVTLSEYKPLWWKCQCRDRLYEP